MIGFIKNLSSAKLFFNKKFICLVIFYIDPLFIKLVNLNLKIFKNFKNFGSQSKI